MTSASPSTPIGTGPCESMMNSFADHRRHKGLTLPRIPSNLLMTARKDERTPLCKKEDVRAGDTAPRTSW